MSDFVFDMSQATHYEGEESKRIVQQMFMRAADDAPDIDTAIERLRVGRPRVVEQREESVKVNARFPQAWSDWISEQAEKLGVSRSQVIRDTFARGMATLQ